MAGREILEEGNIITRVRRTVGETQESSRVFETNFEPHDIKIWRFKIHESCNRSVDVAVSTDTTFEAERGVKVIVGDTERVRGNTVGQLGFGEEEKIGKVSREVVFHRGEVGVETPNVTEMNRERRRSRSRRVRGGSITAVGRVHPHATNRGERWDPGDCSPTMPGTGGRQI